MFNPILVAIDQSACSQGAFEMALGLAKDLGSELLLVHALDVFDPASPSRPQLSANGYSMELDDLLHQNYERQWNEFVQHYESLLQQHQRTAEAAGVSTRYLQPYGHPGPAICRTAKEHSAELIVVGSHGRKGLREMFLGSVSNYIMHHAPCSVMVIHPDSHSKHTPVEKSSALSSAGISA